MNYIHCRFGFVTFESKQEAIQTQKLVSFQLVAIFILGGGVDASLNISLNASYPQGGTSIGV